MFDFQWSGNVQGGRMNCKMENDYAIGMEKEYTPHKNLLNFMNGY